MFESGWWGCTISRNWHFNLQHMTVDREPNAGNVYLCDLEKVYSILLSISILLNVNNSHVGGCFCLRLNWNVNMWRRLCKCWQKICEYVTVQLFARWNGIILHHMTTKWFDTNCTIILFSLLFVLLEWKWYSLSRRERMER